MKRLVILVGVVVIAWSAYWGFAAITTKSALSGWLDMRRSEGWSAEASDISVRGYPYRLDTTITSLSLGDPDTGLAWEAGFFQILALAYRPNHVIAVWSHEQLIATPFEKYDVATSQMRASLVLGANTSLPLARASLVADSLNITARSGGITRMTALHAAAQNLPDGTHSYKFAITADGLVPSDPWRQQIDPLGLLPRAFNALTLDMVVGFNAPWDRFAVEIARPQPTAIKLKLAKAQWGDIELNAAGTLAIDAQGYATGRIAIKARKWREMLRLSVAAGAMPQSVADTIEVSLSLASQLAGNPKSLDITLDFDNGHMALGLIPLGMGPRFQIR